MLIEAEKAYRGVPGQAYRLGCVEPPPFSLPRDDLRPDTTPTAARKRES